MNLKNGLLQRKLRVRATTSLAIAGLLPAACTGIRSRDFVGGEAQQTVAATFTAYLDVDGDGVLQPYEAADALMELMQASDADGDGKVRPSELGATMRTNTPQPAVTAHLLLKEYDRNTDHALSVSEYPDEPAGPFADVDGDGNGAITPAELRVALARITTDPYAIMAEEVFDDLDLDRNGALESSEIPDDLRGDLPFLPIPASLRQLATAFRNAEPPAAFAVQGSKAVMTGVIGSSTPGRVLALIVEHPTVDTIEMPDVPGSLDDVALVRAGRLVRRHGLSTHLPPGAIVASGGTDFFLAGTRRTAAPDARLGVHSWDDPHDDTSGAPQDRAHPAHRKYLAYYRAIGIAEEFYWYTLHAAPAEEIHWMTESEMKRYGVLTGPWSEDPTP